MSSIGWLHLTDLHFGAPAGRHKRPQLLERFFEDLKALHSSSGPWDLILFTGDLAWSGETAQFLEADKFLDRLLEELHAMGSDDPVLLSVPGNHDVAWPAAKDPGLLTLGAWNTPNIQSLFWDDPENAMRKTVAAAHREYETWWKRRSEPRTGIRHGTLMPGDFSFTFERYGVKIGIVGLNTTFLQLSAGVNEVAVGVQQFNEACGGSGATWTKEHHACLLMTHHPPSWLMNRREFEEEVMNPQNFTAHFFGHMHEADYSTIGGGGADFRRFIQGKSLFGYESYVEKGVERESRLHGYSAGRLDLDEQLGQLTFWPRKAVKPGGEWRFAPDHEDFQLSDEACDDCTRPESIKLKKKYSPPGIWADGGADPPSMTLKVGRDRSVLFQVEGRPQVKGSVELNKPVKQFVEWSRSLLVDEKIDESQLALMGKFLFHALFNGKVRREFDLARERLSRVRLKLELSDAEDELAALPWEYMYWFHEGRAKKQEAWVGVDTDFVLSRYVPDTGAGRSFTPDRQKLRVLVIAPPESDPDSRKADSFVEALEGSEGKPLQGVSFVPFGPRTLQQMAASLQPPEEYHFVHFIGRLRHLKVGGEERTEICFPEGNAPNLNDFVNWLTKPQASPKSILLQLVESVKGSQITCLAELARDLMAKGVPYVVAMQCQISDHAAVEFATAFYQALASGRNVANAVQEGRHRVYENVDKKNAGMPVVFLSTDSALIEPQPKTEPPGQKFGAARSAPITDTRTVREQGAPPQAPAIPAADLCGAGDAQRPPARPSPSPGPSVSVPQAGGARVPGAGVPISVLARIKKAAWKEGKLMQLENETREMVSAIPWGEIDAASLKVLFEAKIQEEFELSSVYEAMLAVLTEGEDGGV